MKRHGRSSGYFSHSRRDQSRDAKLKLSRKNICVFCTETFPRHNEPVD